MAKQLQPLEIILGIKGAEKLAALKSSFRDLTKTVKQSDADIESARKSVNDYVKSANNSEAVIEGQIKAFEGLRKQAAMGGKVYRELSDDITELRAQLTGSTSAIDAQRKSILELASGAQITAKQLQAAVDQLFALRNETKLDSVAFNALGKDIDGLTARISGLAEQAKRTASENKAAVASVNATLAKYEASAKSQAANAARREQIVRDEVLALSEKKKVTDELIQKENQLTAVIKRRRQLSVQEGAREARRRVRAGAQVYTGKGELGPIDALDERLGDLPNTTAAFSQRLSELQDRLVNTVRGGNQYIQVALRIAQVQREASAATQGLGAALVNDLASGVAVRNQRNLREAIGQLQAEMSELNTETAEGSAKYAENAAQVNRLQKELDGIANSYRTVADMAQQAAAAQGAYFNTATVRNYLNRAAVRAQEVAGAQFAEAVRAGVASTPLMLPAAGQTTAPGTGAAMSGGAVPLRGTRGPLQPIVGLPTDLGTVGGRRQRPAGVEAQINDEARRSYISQTDAVRANTEAKEQARRVEMAYRAEIRKASAANNGSIQAHQRLRAAIENYRVTLPENSKRFALMTKRIQELDAQAEKTSRRMSRRQMSSMQMTQAAGAAISGGIFGGPEGFLGGVGGALVGGVGGAFAGAAFGAQLGGFRKQLGDYTEMAAEIQRLRLGLAGASNDFADFVNATQATEQASQRLLIPLAESYRIMTQLRANTVELGISTDDTRKIFEGITASIYKTGGGLAEVQGAMRAVVQVLSKGAPQAEELRGQLGERLPAAIIDFAKFTQRTPEELADAFQKSEVTLEEFVDFAKNKFKENEGYLDNLATNAEYAGRRYEKALERLQLTLGRTFQTTGAALQDFASDFLNAIDGFILSLNELGLVSKGPQTLMQEFLSAGKGIKELDAELKTLEAQVAKMRKDKVGSFATDLFEPLFAFTVPAGTRKALEERIKNLKGLRQILDQLDQQTKEREKANKDAQNQAAEKQRATSLLNVIEQRENAIAQARIQLEEQAANIRKQAIEQAKQLEENIAKQRLDKERQIEDLRRQLAYVEEDIALSAEEAGFVAGGGDPEVFRVRREIIEFARQQKEEEISLDRQLLDEQTETQKAIEEFKSNNAKAIMEANTAHAKQIGRIQQEYARSVARIVEEGTKRAGKRLEIAARLAAYYVDRASINYQRAELGASVIPTASGVNASGQPIYPGMSSEEVPGAIQDIDKQIAKAAKELYQLPTATTIAAPAIDSISMSFEDLNSSLAASAKRLEDVRDQIRAIRRDVSGAEILKKVSEVFAQQGAGIFSRQRTMQSEAQKRSNVLRYREEGFSESVAQQLAEQEAQVVSSLKNLEIARDEALKQFPGQQEEIKLKFIEIEESIRGSHDAVRDLTIALDNIPTEIKLRTVIVDLKQQLKDLVDPANQIKSAAIAVGDAFAASFIDAISGAKTAQEALADFFKSVASYFLDMAKQIIAKMIQIAILNTVVKLFPGLGSSGGSTGFNLNGMSGAFAPGGSMPFPMLADGGPASANKPYIVGERGPELFIPNRSGIVAPNSSLGNTNIVVNVDATGSSVQGDKVQSDKLGKAIGVAVQAELIKQKRPGGLLSS